MLNSKPKFLVVVSLVLCLSISSLAETTKIGILVPLTGNYSALGEDCRLGLEVAKQSGDFSKLNFVFADSQADPKTSISEFNRLIDNENISAVVVSRSGPGLAINPLSLKKRIPVLGIVGHEEFKKQNSYAFQFFPTPSQEGAKLAQVSLASGKTRAAIILSDDDWVLTLGTAFKNAFVSGGGLIVQEELIPTSVTDLSTILVRGISKKPDLVFLNVSLGAIAPGLRRLHERTPDIKVISNFWVGKPEVIEAAGIEQIEGVGFDEVSLERNNFLNAYSRIKTESSVSMITYVCYSAFAALEQISSRSKVLLDSETIYQALLNLDQIQLLDERLMVKDRLVNYSIAYKEIRAGKVVEVK